MELIKIGASGEFPEGKISKDDQGELRVVISADRKSKIVKIYFGKSVDWLGLPKHEALKWAKVIKEKAEELV